jgi:hypothetical protein
MVSFNLEGSRGNRAVNVCVLGVHHVPDAEGKRLPVADLRYAGFEQKGNVRSYRFDRVSQDDNRKTFVVTTDLALFAKHHIALQEGPGLCLRLLAANLKASGVAQQPLLKCSLTDREMLAYLASRPIPRVRSRPRRPPRAAAATTQSV